jgi:hypothetical protein
VVLVIERISDVDHDLGRCWSGAARRATPGTGAIWVVCVTGAFTVAVRGITLYDIIIIIIIMR